MVADDHSGIDKVSGAAYVHFVVPLCIFYDKGFSCH